MVLGELVKVTEVRVGDCVIDRGRMFDRHFVVESVSEGEWSVMWKGVGGRMRRYYQGWEVEVHEADEDCRFG